MKEITKMPVKVTNGNEGFEVYEYEDGFCMTSEYLGQRLGYAEPRRYMSRLFRQNKEGLESHQFVIFKGDKLGGRGRPSYFYDLRGCEMAAAFAGTKKAKELYTQLSDLRAKLEAKRIEHIERYWFGKRPFWPEIRERVMLGENFRVIAEAMGRSAASVRNAVSRMIEVGILQPLRAVQALTGTARKAVIRYSRKFIRDDRQLLLPGIATE